MTVSDTGRWRAGRPHEHRGLQLARALADRVDVHTDGTGTTVALVRRVQTEQPVA